MKNNNKNKKKIFLNKFLLATTSIGLLISTEVFADNVTTSGVTLKTSNQDDWVTNNGRKGLQNNDNIIITKEGVNIRFDTDTQLGNINLNGYKPNEFKTKCKTTYINNIINTENSEWGGNTNAKVKVVLGHAKTRRSFVGEKEKSNLYITGDDVNAVESFELTTQNTLSFQNDITVNAPIFSKPNAGVVKIEGNDVVFEKSIGAQSQKIEQLQIIQNKKATLKSSLYSNSVILEKGAELILDPSNQEIFVNSSIESYDGSIKVKPAQNAVTFAGMVGAHNNPVSEIQIGSEVKFEREVYTKKIDIAINKVSFDTKLDLNHNSEDIGTLNFIDNGRVEFHKEFKGKISTNKDGQGYVKFDTNSNTNPSQIGLNDQKLKYVIFQGPSNLHGDIHAQKAVLNGGTFDIKSDIKIESDTTIIRNSKFNINNNLSFGGDVIFAGSITFNISEGKSINFETKVPKILSDEVTIDINVNNQAVVDQATALEYFKVEGNNLPNFRYDDNRGLIWDADENAKDQFRKIQFEIKQAEEEELKEVPKMDNQSTITQQDMERVPNLVEHEKPEKTRKSEEQNLSKAIINIAAPMKNIVVTKTQKEVIKATAASIMENPKNAVEVAQNLKDKKAELVEASKIANDDKAIKSKTGQEQALLFAVNLVQKASGNEKETINRLADQGTRVVSAASLTTEAVSSNIYNHLGGNTLAIAAGDEDSRSITKEAVWVAGTFGSSYQDEYKGNASYNGKVAGGTIGGDLYIGDNNIVGIAYSRMNSDFKFKGSNQGDSLKADSNIISLYGQQQFGGGFLLQEILSFSDSKITKKNLKFGKIAQGKYTSKAYAVEANIGYQFAPLEGMNLVPNIGIRYNNYKDSGYKETGAGVNNMMITSNSGNLVTGIAGVKMIAPQQLSNDLQIIPGLHASVENCLSSEQPKVKARFIWADSYFENNSISKMQRTTYNIGASVLTKHKNVELLATYNCNLRSKYQSHQGSLKLKLLF